MIASHVTSEILESAATKVGVRAEIRPLNSKGTRFNVQALPGSDSGHVQAGTVAGLATSAARIGATPESREMPSISGSRWGLPRPAARVNAVCWHGFRDFFRAVYEQDSAVTFRTAVDTWKNAADFELRFAASGHRNIGPPIAPVCMADACRCPDRGYAG